MSKQAENIEALKRFQRENELPTLSGITPAIFGLGNVARREVLWRVWDAAAEAIADERRELDMIAGWLRDQVSADLWIDLKDAEIESIKRRYYRENKEPLAACPHCGHWI